MVGSIEGPDEEGISEFPGVSKHTRRDLGTATGLVIGDHEKFTGMLLLSRSVVFQESRLKKRLPSENDFTFLGCHRNNLRSIGRWIGALAQLDSKQLFTI